MRPSKLPVNESSPAMYPAKIGYSFGYDTPRANHLKRHLANESSPQCNTVTRCVHEILSRHTVTKYVHEILSRHTVTKYVHEILSRCTVMKYVHEVYSTMIAKVSRNSNKCMTDTCNPRNRTYESKCKYASFYCVICTI